MSKKPCSISFKSAGDGVPCTTVINGKLVVKGDAVFRNNVTTKKDLNVNNLIFSTETIDESGQEVSPTKSISFINTNGVGELDDACCDGFYKKIVKINDASASEWETLSDINGTVRVIAFDEFNNDEGPYIGGDFTSVNGNTALKYLAKYDVGSSSWTSVKSGGDNVSGSFLITPYITTISFGPSGDGPYIGGVFSKIDNKTSIQNLAKYDSGSDSWTSIKSGGDGLNANFGNVSIITFGQSGDGPYVGGEYVSGMGGNFSLKHLAKYDTGSDSWTSVKSGGDNIPGLVDIVRTIAFGPSGDGPYIGGGFLSVDGDASLINLAKYDSGSDSWTSVKSGGDNVIGGRVFSIAFGPSSEGPYIGGQFTSIDGDGSLINLAKYDSSSDSWTSVKSGGDNMDSDRVNIITFNQSGDGPYIGGFFLEVGGNTALTYFAKYDSSSDSWTSVKSEGDEVDNEVNTITFSPSETGPYIGGNFTEVGGETANNKLAYWQDEQVYKLTYNTTETLTLTNKGDEATLVYNTNPTNSWIKLT